MKGQQRAVKVPLSVKVGFVLTVCSRAVNALVQASVVVAPHIALKGHVAFLKRQKRRKHEKAGLRLKQHQKLSKQHYQQHLKQQHQKKHQQHHQQHHQQQLKQQLKQHQRRSQNLRGEYFCRKLQVLPACYFHS